MIQQLKPALVLFVLLTLLTGVVYPLVITGSAQAFSPAQANGSLIDHNGVLIGSKLIGQNFTDPKYFWGRPSATAGAPYTALDLNTLTGSSGSNLGPLSQALVDVVRQRVAALHAADPENNLPIPVDLVTASASGLDPDISVAAAYYQVNRVARLRGMSVTTVQALVDQYTSGRQLGLLGEPRVNILLLNLALDAIK
jgi:potassium-transporting ATPase KdpC subunit